MSPMFQQVNYWVLFLEMRQKLDNVLIHLVNYAFIHGYCV
jgi:hypothetical protein